MKVAKPKQGTVISQKKRVPNLLKEIGMTGCKPTNTPKDPNHKLGSDLDGSLVDKGIS